MPTIADTKFSDIYILASEHKAYIPDKRTLNALMVFEPEDFDDFFKLVESSWDGKIPSYSVNYQGIYYRVERSEAISGIQYCIRKMPSSIPSVRVLGYPTELVNFLLTLRRSSGLILCSGPTGSGKTTLINLLMRFYDPQSGTISIDGQNIATVKRESLRKSFGMVLQDTWLKNGTIRENIALGRPDATDDEVAEAARLSHIDTFISSLPNGYDEIVSDDSDGISAGQKQLISISRIMLSEPEMLILDEATSSIDTRTELMIQEAFMRLMKGRTSFIVAHRLSTIRTADLILVIKDGDVIESGNHRSLMEKGGFYASMYRSQFSS